MKKFFFIFSLLMACNLFAVDLLGWKKLYSKKGLSFYSKKLKGSSLLNFRAVGELKVKTQEALAILRDVESTSKWDGNTKLKKTIENISDIEAITYSITTIPWPFRDRDMVLVNKLYFDKDRMSLRVDVKSISRKDYPKKRKLVRAELDVKMWIRPKNTDTALIDLQILVNPKGSIPHWVVNIVQQSMPYDFLQGLAKRARKIQIDNNPGVKSLYGTLISNIKMLQEQGRTIPVF
jgi:hypothetical protein